MTDQQNNRATPWTPGEIVCIPVQFIRTLGQRNEDAHVVVAESNGKVRSLCVRGDLLTPMRQTITPEYAALIAAAPQLAEALREIANVGGNLPDDTLTTRAGANDAVARGLMVVGARSIARAALKAAGISE